MRVATGRNGPCALLPIEAAGAGVSVNAPSIMMMASAVALRRCLPARHSSWATVTATEWHHDGPGPAGAIAYILSPLASGCQCALGPGPAGPGGGPGVSGPGSEDESTSCGHGPRAGLGRTQTCTPIKSFKSAGRRNVPYVTRN